ncbi:hypothetical protein F9C11_19040 [Amycolatopsis sp. VS8301801F10]|uniref:hypothetical protein n=1 Tax=Amycolatopsis sp. VS8301801F10 TaxID=2652442 RepID=UPI0038FC5C9C
MADAEISVLGEAKPPKSGPELMTSDVDPKWLVEQGVDPAKAQPLSETGLTAMVQIPAGQTSGELTIPTVRHAGADPAKQVLLHVTGDPRESGPDADVTGTVTDAG